MPEKNKSNELEVLHHLAKGNPFVLYIYRRITKVSCAVYVVTDLIKDIEPLKWQLRKTASEMALLGNFTDERSVFKSLELSLLELEGTIELARFAKAVSDMNADILESEIRKLLSELRERSKEGFYAPELVASFFSVPKPPFVTFQDFVRTEEQAAEALKEETVYKGHKGQVTKNDFYHSSKPRPDAQTQKQFEQPGATSKGHRKDELLAIVKRKGSVMIKDITEQIRDCSEKTIQRELLSLVDQGLLKKTGERRWSRYELARP